KAMVHNPPVLILDEPTAGVDVELRRQLWSYVLELNRKGVTIVLTTHYLEEAQELCDQIAIINKGEVVACEPTTTLLRRMDTRKVLVTPAEPVEAAPKLPGFETHLLPAAGCRAPPAAARRLCGQLPHRPVQRRAGAGRDPQEGPAHQGHLHRGPGPRGRVRVADLCGGGGEGLGRPFRGAGPRRWPWACPS